LHVLLYRDAVRAVSSRAAMAELSSWLDRASTRHEAALAALLLAGELEAALSDLASPMASRAAELTNELARSWIGGAARTSTPLAALGQGTLPETFSLKRPEGYAYYALEPASYAALARARVAPGERAAVVGVRSIGTSLSAIVSAALEQAGSAAPRTTVRPVGHPYDRRLEADAAFQRFVSDALGARFLIVDEGPGLSGSTFLAVGECLERLGVPLASIELLTSHAVQPECLVAVGAAERWARFRACAAEPSAIEGAEALGAGDWRGLVYRSAAHWPACSPGLERRKLVRHRSGGGSPAELVKFEGFPPYGAGALERGRRLADAGFGPVLRAERSGYLAQKWCAGRPLSLARIFDAGRRERALERLLQYLAFRHAEFPAAGSDLQGLEQMARVNVSEALGRELPGSFRLELERPVLADARLDLHEWIESGDERLLKVDALDHCDDHCWPGPCDAAWDVAGALVEWRIGEAAGAFLDRYRALTGDSVASRIGPYLTAYSALRTARMRFARGACGPSEHERLTSAEGYYIAQLARQAGG
jgi:hypothetical protein